MRSSTESTLLISTPTGRRNISVFAGNIYIGLVSVDYGSFSGKCKQSCCNYNIKLCCPPHSPRFETLAPDNQWLHVICLRMALDQLPSFKNPYHRVRMANVMLKSRLTRVLLAWRAANPEDYVLGSGACRACKRCAAIDELPCKKPEKRIYSLEATGVNCEHLVKACFGFGLEWYSPGRPCSTTLVVGGILSERQHLPELARLIHNLLGSKLVL